GTQEQVDRCVRAGLSGLAIQVTPPRLEPCAPRDPGSAGGSASIPGVRIPIGAAVLAAACVALAVSDAGPLLARGLAAAQAERTAAGGLNVVTVRPNFFMIAGAGGNVGVQVGDDGVVL